MRAIQSLRSESVGCETPRGGSPESRSMKSSASPPLATPLPPREEMYAALAARDSTYEGVFWVGVTSTGICCRPGCPARTPRPENVEYFPRIGDALSAGYRPCKRCKPLQPKGETPEWMRELMDAIEEDPTRRWKDQDLREMGLDPTRVRRWFQRHHDMSFHAYHRARRLGQALGRIRQGADLTDSAYEAGYESPSAFRDAFQGLFGTTPGRSRGASQVLVTRVLTPLGPMVAGVNEEGLCLLEFADRRMLATQVERLQKRLGCAIAPGENAFTAQIARELEEYFAGERRAFTVPLVLRGTEFQEAVWRELLRIPYGETRSYEQMARAIGRPKAVRALGTANGDNRLAIVVPCHRVIRADGSLSGYGGGKWRKQQLLELERPSAL